MTASAGYYQHTPTDKGLHYQTDGEQVTIPEKSRVPCSLPKPCLPSNLVSRRPKSAPLNTRYIHGLKGSAQLGGGINIDSACIPLDVSADVEMGRRAGASSAPRTLELRGIWNGLGGFGSGEAGFCGTG